MSVIAKGRATMRSVSEKRRQVFKHALGKPHAMAWPETDQETQSAIVDMLCKALGPLGTYFAASRQASKRLAHRKRRAVRSAKNSKNKDTPSVEPSERFPATIDNYASIMAGKELLAHVVLGINGTTRMLEKQARSGSQIPESERIALVVVCKGDVDPQMVAHFPGLAHTAHAAINSGGRGETTKSGDGGLRLVGVGKGAEQKLANAVCQHRVSVVGIKAGAPLLDEIVLKARVGVAPPVVSWIGTTVAGSEKSAAPAAAFRPMQVHELHTTAPIQDKKRGGAAANQKADAPSSVPSSAPPADSGSSVDTKKRRRDSIKAAGGGTRNRGPAPKQNKKNKVG
ncbi:RNase P and RNase MRP subunit [Coemansia sp. RSA 2337]|nr:RNase P and RNase MRP subunit [Coemansia sp. S680]KAJ2106217.1 RNase P and RNase MRP subunit [Coemansia sp. RSA 922]KAJ2417786.1 RNase P and RNase MRP subunit [Coemansia sp. RSA 2531]KAJ2459816.1 RNase P and RNase MRP subunit [Coemansia sp. RSA 2337]